MASRYDIFNPPNGEPDWKAVIFPNAHLHALPEEVGIYRFACCKSGKWITLFVDISHKEPCKTLRSSYKFHSDESQNDTAQLADLYSTDDMQFEHCSCEIREAKRYKNNLLIEESPYFNSYKFIINFNQGAIDPFDSEI